MDNKKLKPFDFSWLKGRNEKKRMGWKSYLAIAAAAAFFIMMMAVSIKAFSPVPRGSHQAQNSQASNNQAQNNGSGSETPKTEKIMKPNLIAAPEYPAKTRLYSDNFEPQRLDTSFVGNLQDFLSRSSSAVLSAGAPGSNQIFSPVSLYMALAMTANGANGETRNEILKALSMDNFDMAVLDQQTNRLYKNLYFDNDAGQLKLANSLWLDNQVPFKKDFLQNLAQNYFAYSFIADFTAAPKTAEQINEWMAANTEGNLGQDDNSRLEFNSPNEGAVALFNTAYFRDEWSRSFLTAAQGQFHLPAGTATVCKFMNVTDTANYLKGSNYAASYRDFANGGKMVFILPDQGVSPYDLIKNSQFIAGTVNGLFSTESRLKEVTFKVPEFNYKNNLNLNNTLEKLGIKKAFLSDSAEFPNIAESDPLAISRVEQAACISVDVLGCEATARTAVILPDSGDPPENLEKVDLTLDRPFIFVITMRGDFYNNSHNNLPLLVGIVNNPAAQ